MAESGSSACRSVLACNGQHSTPTWQVQHKSGPSKAVQQRHDARQMQVTPAENLPRTKRPLLSACCSTACSTQAADCLLLPLCSAFRCFATQNQVKLLQDSAHSHSTKPQSTRLDTSAQAHLRQMPRQWAADSPSLLQAATSGPATNNIYRKKTQPQQGLRVQTMGSTALQDSQPNSARASVKTHRVQAEAPSQAPETRQHTVQGYMQRSRST
jgi:hypothetical protein